ncbi:mCG140851, partial [Mus musculus]
LWVVKSRKENSGAKELALCSPHSPLPPFLSFFLFFFKIDCFITCKYSVAIFRHTRRGHQIS